MTSTAVRIERRGAVAMITIDCPGKRNALDRAAGDALARAFVAYEAGDATCAVLTGAGDEAFTGGLDVNDPPDPSRFVPGAGVTLEKPLIAAVAGWCVGVGVPLVMMSDLAIAADNARFLYPEGRIGFTGGVAASLVARIPHKEAMRLMLLGEPMSADWAKDVGLVNEVVPAGRQVERAMEWAEIVAAQAPLVVRTLKRFANRILPSGPSEVAARIRGELEAVANSRDAEEGTRAFREKRPPKFTGD